MSDIQINLVSDSSSAQFDPHAYTIVIKRVIRDEPVFHGRVMELPDLEAFEPTYEEAYNFLIEGIRNSKEAFDEEGRQFPAPHSEDPPEFSGRVTIRMPAWLHAQLDYSAQVQQTSLNQYMVTLLSWASAAAPRWVSQNLAVGTVGLGSVNAIGQLSAGVMVSEPVTLTGVAADVIAASGVIPGRAGHMYWTDVVEPVFSFRASVAQKTPVLARTAKRASR